ncbi:MAG: hypothetical protein ACI4VF_00105, partial [Lachnospirales bacterium]
NNTEENNGGETIANPLDTIKAAIPYLDEKYQKNMNLMVRFIELDRLIGNISALSTDENKDRPIKILQAVKGELDVKKQRIIDIFVRVMEIKNLMEDMANG